MVDDYAHHPEELRALITGIRSLYKEKLTLVFQPHLFSRTKDQAEGFAAVLDTADEVWLLPIYPARELPMEGITSEWLLSKMKLSNKKIVTKESLLELAAAERPALLVTAGAGDIDTMVTPLKNILSQ
jgi:UDP-N-acetylmuramate--alanine ligase